MASAAKPLPLKPLTATLRLDLHLIEAGVPLATLNAFVASSGIPLKDVYDIVIPARTLKHRRERKQNLTRDESDKLARLVRIYDFSVRVFGDKTLAREWMQEPKERFSGRSPLAMLGTDLGGRLVEEFLIQIDEGMFV